MNFVQIKEKLIIGIFYVCLVFASTEAKAQDYEQDYDYEYDEYYEEENDYNNNYYERYSANEYARRQQRQYKRAAREEELYNGGYRRRSGSSDQGGAAGGIGGFWGLGRPGSNNNTEKAPVEKEKFDHNNLDDASDKDPSENNDGLRDVNGAGTGSGTDQPGSGDDEPKHEETGPPTVPTDPDIPIDTAVPYLLAMGLGFFAFKLHQFKQQKTA
ncbi:MAG: hypothetical protein ACK5XN_11695 [Bacteroidota bacterium]|jgi:hypothetical protein